VNKLATLPKYEHKLLREVLFDILGKKDPPELHTEDVSAVQMHLPVDVGGFTDFSCSMEHCLNAGEAIMKKRVLPPGFLHFPIGYTGRASSIVVCVSISSHFYGCFAVRRTFTTAVVLEPFVENVLIISTGIGDSDHKA
jgi:hypothetical protein